MICYATSNNFKESNSFLLILLMNVFSDSQTGHCQKKKKMLFLSVWCVSKQPCLHIKLQSFYNLFVPLCLFIGPHVRT